MTNMKALRRALISSTLAVVLCLGALVGATFAWFTDSVTSANNKIVAGNLDVDLYLWDGNGATEITEESAPIFGPGSLAQDDAAETLWEPGKTQVVYLSIKNNGSLDLKYKVALNVENPANSKDLYKVLRYAITNGAQYSTTDPAWQGGLEVDLGLNATQAVDVPLAAGAEHFFALSIHMEETAGNEYMNGSVIFDIQVLAGQLASEEDSFGADYDQNAGYPGTGVVTIDRTNTTQSAVEVTTMDMDNKYHAATFMVPMGAVAADAQQVAFTVTDSAYVGNFAIATDMEKKVVEIAATGLAENNTTPVKASIKIPANLDPTTVKLYHYDTLIDSTYNPNTGYVTFETATFSPFTVVYDADSEYDPAIPEGMTIPTAIVTEYTDTQNIVWGNYGQWSPTEGLEANLEAAYTFKCPELSEEVYNAFAGWYCDFYVSLDKDLGANQLFLGGNYGTFGWVGFHNGDLTLDANTEIGLLESVTTNPWTYADVAEYVGEFICGVGDVNNALSGATFTVKLRLTNPANSAVFHDVNTVEYTFN